MPNNIFYSLARTGVFFLFLCMLLPIVPSLAQLTWPQGQILPTFPPSALTQDFVNWGSTTVLGTMIRWEAEGPSLGHKMGRLETDGWLCQVGIDAPNDHMIYGPYVTNVPIGPNIAEFRMKIDNNSANNDPVVDLDVRDATTGQMLATQTITRQQFTVAGSYTSFRLPFTMPADNHSIELRVYWRGASYIKVDWVGVQPDNTIAEGLVLTSLKGVVNRTQPRIFTYEGDAHAEGPYTWMQSLGLNWNEVPDRWSLVTKYRNELNGIIVYDPAQTHTINLATTLAKDRKALIASPALIPKLTAAPYNLPILLDLRGQFSSKLQVYQTLYSNYWSGTDRRLLIGINPDLHVMSSREYAVAVGAAVIWLDPQVAEESTLLNQFLSSMPAGGNYMGWWPEEGSGVSRGSQYGVATIASDWCTNLTVHSGMPRTVNVKPIPQKPTLQNKIYVAFIMSDGDNLQYVEHLMRKLWNDPNRGAVPIGWTVSAAMIDAMPGALNYFHQTATPNDNLISGPSGYGYVYPNDFSDGNKLYSFISKSEEYNERAGLRIITVWNTILGGINQSVGEAYARYAPTLLGVTAQNTGGPLAIYNQSLPSFPLSCNYCYAEDNVKAHVASAAAGWNGAEPRFIIVQTQPWQDMTPTRFKAVYDELKTNSNYVFVRPDHIFQLIREHNGLLLNPSSGKIARTFSECDYSGFSAALEVGDYNMARLQAIGAQDDNLSSIKISQGFKVVLYQHDNFTGASVTLTSNVNCFDVTWNNKVTSLKVLPNGDAGLGIGPYYLQNRNSNLYMDVWGISQADGANIAQGSYNGGLNQRFRFEHLGDGAYKLVAVHSGKVVDVEQINKDNGANVMQGTYFGTPNQHFIAVPTGDGFYKLVGKHSGRLLDVINTTTANGADIHQWDNNNQASGQWRLVTVAPPPLNGPMNVSESDQHIYPNPVNNTLFLSPEMVSAQIRVTNQLGIVVLEEAASENNSIDVSRLSAGTYSLSATGRDGKRSVKRFIKQ